MKVTRLVIVTDYEYKEETVIYDFNLKYDPKDSHDEWILERLGSADIVMMAEIIPDGATEPRNRMVKIWDRRLGWQNGFGHFNHWAQNKEDCNASTSQA